MTAQHGLECHYFSRPERLIKLQEMKERKDCRIPSIGLDVLPHPVDWLIRLVSSRRLV